MDTIYNIIDLTDDDLKQLMKTIGVFIIIGANERVSRLNNGFL